MGKIYERTLQGIGQSLLVTLPKNWIKTLGLKKGSTVKIMANEKGTLIIAAELTQAKEEKSTTIEYNESFMRQFFRVYFEGNTSITITLSDTTQPQKEEIYSFLQKFLNLQIVAEDDNKILVKSFRINELNIIECLKRMHQLSLNMIDEVLENNNKRKLEELEQALTRLYYLLVLQTRRFLDEGQYTENNQISLIRAMDMRMVAEKVERIADVTQNLKASHGLKETREYYRAAFSAFSNENFSQAIKSWQQERRVAKKITDQKIRSILNYARQISSLVR